MKIRELFRQEVLTLSFEVFPPVREGNLESLYRAIGELKSLKPDFFSVTYGAGGSTRDRSLEIASKVRNDYGQEVMAHLTCVQSTKDEIAGILDELRDSGIENILALRGDPPLGQEKSVKTEGGFGYANELVEFIRSRGDFCIAVAGYPEGHIEAPSLEEDLRNLKRKVDAGADFIISQLFFDNDVFYRFRDRAWKAGIRVPLLPGVFPVMNYKQMLRCISLSNASVPKKLAEKMDRLQDKPEETEKYGVEYAVGQAEDLIRNEVQGLHIYSMNRSGPVIRIIEQLEQHLLLLGRA
ncbi:MAG TPA: methylenetetrahydrofolate reductase [NAD(P)H], partial [Syntrophales bacterium]|nr:methylenetetrahydrofolate reductase [NAD(P)H] [Syntrophales bacterium]